MEHNDKKWLEKYEIAKSYYLEFGNLLVPDKFNYKGINLGNWIYIQRHSYKEKKLNQNRIRLLSEINMIWDALPDFDEMWEKSFTLASDFKNEFGTIIIPINFVYKNYSIGKWISHQRQLYKKNKLSEDRIHKLESIGMVWDASNNNISTSFPEQAIFYYVRQLYPDSINRYNDLGFELDIFIPSLNLAIEYDGYVWHINNKNDIIKNKKCFDNNIRLIRIRESGLEDLPNDSNVKIIRINRGYSDLENVINTIICYLDKEKLKVVNIDLVRDKNNIIKNYINVYNDQWNKMYHLAKDYYSKNSNLINIKDQRLNGWISHQRQRYVGRKNPLTNEQIKKLESIGMIWDASVDIEKIWDNYYSIAKDYYLEHKNLNIKIREKYKGINLGSWINKIRNEHDKLSDEQIDNLNKIGMIWNVHKDKWDANYNLLLDYYKANNNILIPFDYIYKNVKLGQWLKRQMISKNKLTPKQVKLLDNLGIVWKRNSNKWDEMFDLAKEYYLEHKNLLVDTHSKYKGQNLGYWINHQRDDYKKRNTDNANVDFSLDRIHKLESIGMVWDVNDYLWNKNYEILSEYYSLNGDVDIPSSLEYKNIKLGKWLQNQKSSYKGYKGRKKLTEEQIIKLEKLNIKFK